MSSLVEAKKMYLRKLVQILSPELYLGLKTMYHNVEQFCKQHQLKESVAYFQKELEKIPTWSRDRLSEETLKIQSKTDCDYLLDIITTLLMVNMRILLDDTKSNVNLEIPQLYVFIHKCYTLVGSELWSNPELMTDKGSSSERQKNYIFVMKLIQQSINDAIQFYLPMKPILNRYLRNDNNQDIEEELELSNELSNELSDEEEFEEHLENDSTQSQNGDTTFFEDASDNLEPVNN